MRNGFRRKSLQLEKQIRDALRGKLPNLDGLGWPLELHVSIDLLDVNQCVCEVLILLRSRTFWAVDRLPKTARTIAEICNRLPQVLSTEIGPQGVIESEFSIGRLPK
jgi:hypothetical protein